MTSTIGWRAVCERGIQNARAGNGQSGLGVGFHPAAVIAGAACDLGGAELAFSVRDMLRRLSMNLDKKPILHEWTQDECIAHLNAMLEQGDSHD
jgi:hypothetical protein